MKNIYFFTLFFLTFLFGCIKERNLLKTTTDLLSGEVLYLLGQKKDSNDSFETDRCQEHTLEELDDWDIEIDDDCYINWMLAVKRGDITPLDTIENETYDYEIESEESLIIFQPKGSVGDVIFSHPIHIYWLGCNGCHYGRRIFIPRRGANPITMGKIAKGEYCGVCHGPHGRSGSFNMLLSDNCKKCHQTKSYKIIKSVQGE